MAESDALYCTLTPAEQRARRSEVRATIAPQVTAVSSLTKGITLEFGHQKGLRDLVQEFIALEQSCCSFLTFSLSPPTEALRLQIEGPPEAAQVIELFRRTAEGQDR